jgi:glutaredoxin
MRRLAWVSALVLVCGAEAYADLYKYIDKDGRTTYSDQPPPASARSVERKILTDSVVDVDKVPFATLAAAKKYPVTLYANACGDPCAQAKALLARRGIPFQLRNPETSTDDADALRKLVGGLQVPALTVGASPPLRGFEEDAWNRSLDAAGYPRTNLGVRTDTAKDAEAKAAANAVPPPAAVAPPAATPATASTTPPVPVADDGAPSGTHPAVFKPGR